ncbi:MAG: cytochrome P450 [Parvularculales bacterium]
MKISQELSNTIVDPAAYADFDQIHEAFTEIRKNTPVALVEAEGFDPFWLISKFEDVQHVEKSSDLFHAGDRMTVLTEAQTIRNTIEEIGTPFRLMTLINMDPPRHTVLRDLTADWFGPRSLRNLEPRIRQRAQQTLKTFEEIGGECDFAKDIALYYPLRVIMDILGVPDEGEEFMLKMTQDMFSASDEDMMGYKSKEERDAAMAKATMDAFAYFNDINESRRKNPQDDLASVFANGKIDGEYMTDLETIGYYVITATAGHDTTSNSTSAGMWALCQQPEMLSQLKENPDLIAAFVEESIRWETPVKHFMRSATQDSELRGISLKEGDWMMSSFASACRDEDVYDNPFEFDITRKPNRHLALGYGVHVCLGQHLARLEMRILWEELIKRLKSVEMTGPMTRVAASFVSGPKSLPIRFTLH